MLKKLNIKNILLLIGYLLLIIGSLVIIVKIFFAFKNRYELSIEIQNNNLSRNLYNISTKATIKKTQTPNYIANIKIPKINLNRGLVDKNSSLNIVDKNIQILKESSMPDSINGNLILAAHSGNSNVSYFKDLGKLIIGDNVYIQYSNQKYEYRVVNYYIVEKTGLIDIVRNINQTTLTLITCVENTNKQLIVICELYKTTNL